RRVFVGCLSVALAVAVARAPAQEVRWRSASPVSPDQPGGGSAFASERPAAAPNGTGPAALGRPQVLADVTPATFRQAPQGQTEQLPQPMPMGPGGGTADK